MLQTRNVVDPRDTDAATVEAMYGAETQTISPGQTVAEARQLLKHILNVPVHAEARVNGRLVSELYLLEPGETLEFIVVRGEKGGEWSSEAEMLANGATPEQLEQFRATHQRPRDWDESLCGVRYYRDHAILPCLLSLVPSKPADKQIPAPKKQRTMSVQTANQVAMELAKRKNSFVNGSCEEWAKKIGCSASTVRKTALWKATMERTGRGRRDRNAKPKVVSLTPDLESAIGKPDGELERLIAESKADAGLEPSPLDDDPVTELPLKVRHYRKR